MQGMSEVRPDSLYVLDIMQNITQILTTTSLQSEVISVNSYYYDIFDKAMTINMME